MIKLFYKRKTITGIKKLKKICLSTIMVLDAAEQYKIKWHKLPYTGLFKLSYKKETKYFHDQIPSETTEFAYHCCKNKQLASSILSEAGISVCNSFIVKPTDDSEYCLGLFHHLNKPLVVKQSNSSQGKNVFININTENDFLQSIVTIRSWSGQVKVDIIVEEMFNGDEYRILATQKKILSVIKRIPANVIGDGKHTIKQLISLKNKNPLRHSIPTYHEITINPELISYLTTQGLGLSSIPSNQDRVYLLPKSPLDISSGGDTLDVTEEIHPSVNKVIAKIMESIPGLSLTGVDYMTKDISMAQTLDSYRIIEINASPSLDWNQYPLVGPTRNIAFEFLKIMFKKLK